MIEHVPMPKVARLEGDHDRVSVEAQARTWCWRSSSSSSPWPSHERFGASSERGVRLLDQLDRQLADLVGDSGAGRDGGADRAIRPASAARASAGASPIPRPPTCPCCRGKLGEGMTETLKRDPAPEGDPVRAGELLLSGLRGDHPAVGDRTFDCARTRRTGTARPSAVREVHQCPRLRRGRRRDRFRFMERGQRRTD